MSNPARTPFILEKPDTLVSKTRQFGFCSFGFWLEVLPSQLLDTLKYFFHASKHLGPSNLRV
jgi:hypothetical protein